MPVYALRSRVLFFKDLNVTTHPHAEAARQWQIAQPDGMSKLLIDLVVIGPEDLNLSGPQLAVLFNKLTDEAKHVGKFETKAKGQARVFAALETKYGSQEQEPFNPVETPTGLTANPTGATTEDSSEGSNTTEEGPMATKKKTAKKKTAKKTGERKPRVQAPLFVELKTSQPTADMKCGTYIRSLLMKGGKGATTEAILASVAKHYPDSAAKASDVSWNKGKLKAAGKKLPAAE